MIRFACPRCKSVLERPDNVAGTKFACPSCGQRLQVPLPPENKTVLGTPVGNEVPVPQPPAPVPTAAAAQPGNVGAQPGGVQPSGVQSGGAQVRNVQGREHVFWNCPLCQGQVDIALDLGQAAVRCPHCSKKIAVPSPSAQAAETVHAPIVRIVPFAPPFVTESSNPPPAPTRSAPADSPKVLPPPITPRSGRRERDYDDDDDDDDFPSIERRTPRRGRYSKETAAKAASAGLVYSIISLGLLLVVFIMLILTAQSPRGRLGGEREPLVLVILLVVVGSFVLAILGIIFSSRGLDESNTYNRGQATGGLVCGIISLVIGSIVGLFFLCVGLILTIPGGRW